MQAMAPRDSWLSIFLLRGSSFREGVKEGRVCLGVTVSLYAQFDVEQSVHKAFTKREG
jgi:hypothetical protein